MSTTDLFVVIMNVWVVGWFVAPTDEARLAIAQYGSALLFVGLVVLVLSALLNIGEWVSKRRGE